MADRSGAEADRFARGDWALKILPCGYASRGGWLGKDGKKAMVYEDDEITADVLVNLVWFQTEEDAQNFLVARVLVEDEWTKVVSFLVPTKLDKTKYGPIINV